jgi:hypothetical protein
MSLVDKNSGYYRLFICLFNLLFNSKFFIYPNITKQQKKLKFEVYDCFIL